MNSLLALTLDDLSGLRTFLFEEARVLSLTDPTDVLVNRKGSTDIVIFVIVPSLMTMASSLILSRTKSPGLLLSLISWWTYAHKTRIPTQTPFIS